ncbi:MAG: hypothetical protein Q4E63_02485 [Prevotellaceae bacterium]|nr:hypothetical protein [Prevotellaceae bacterium]MDO4931511.1 hypothetical protein [Prevotellaceae bacterium]
MTNIITVLAFIIAVITLIREIITHKKEAKRSVNKAETRLAMLSDYDIVAERTKAIETEQQENAGEHFRDETVYLNRAEAIRLNSRFFDYVNGK